MYASITHWCLYGLLTSLPIQAAQTVQQAADSPTKLLAADVEWGRCFGKLSTDDGHVLVLMARGFMSWPGLGGADFPTEMDERITGWMKAHPKAVVIDVSDLPLGEGVAFRYVWVVDGQESLNIYLVREGMCLADQMLPMKGFENLIIDRERYDRFAVKVTAAEEEAMDARRGVWAREELDARARSKRAGEHLAEKRCQDAANELTGASHPDLGSPWSRVAECFQERGDHEKAIAAFEQSISVSGEPWSGAVLGRARSVAKLKNIGAAVATLQEESDSTKRSALLARFYAGEEMLGETVTILEKAVAELDKVKAEWPDRVDRYASLARVYVEQGMFTEAATVMEKGVVRFIESYRVPFDAEHRFQLEPLRVRVSSFYWDRLHDLPHRLSQLSGSFIQAGDFDKAYKYATMGLSIRQGILTYLSQMPEWEGDYAPEVIEAGDEFLRLKRAKVFIHRRQFSEAKREIDHAKLLVDGAVMGGQWVEQMVSDAYAELRETFPRETVTIPPKYVPKRRKEPSPPKIDYAAAPEDQLMRWADANDPAMRHAALQELIGRDEKGTLPRETFERVIAGCLRRQANAELPWFPSDGRLLARAAERGVFSTGQFSSYVRNSIKFSSPEVWPNQGLSPECYEPGFKVAIRAEVRAGGEPMRERAASDPCGIVGTARVRSTSVDGHEVTLLGSDREDGDASRFYLHRGGIFYSIASEEPLNRGVHRVSVILDVEVRKASRYEYGYPQADDSPPLDEWTIELEADFWAPGPGS